MDIMYAHGTWGLEPPSLEAKLRRIQSGGFQAVETGVPEGAEERRKLRALLEELGLALIAQQWTRGASPREHAESFEEQYRRAVALRPLLVNSHTGKDWFTANENLSILRRAAELERECGVPVVHETHRGRATFSAASTAALLEELPGLKLAADFSHWCCVSESLLADQQESLRKAIARSFHIHARVGHAEAPQVTDPRSPEWRDALEAHLAWWQAIVDRRRESGTGLLAICPEFGPPPYMVRLPRTGEPIADLWEVNCHMKELLQGRLRLQAAREG
jgi:sugar phosphate isomerase/epimerase